MMVSNKILKNVSNAIWTLQNTKGFDYERRKQENFNKVKNWNSI